MSYRPTTNWNLEFDYDYTHWSSLGVLYIERDSATTLLPSTLPLNFNWTSSAYYEFGATRYFDNGWHVSGGYIFNENSVPDSTYQPLVTDLDRHFFSVGIGRKGKRFDFDLAYQFGYGPMRTVSGSANSITVPNATDGQYEFFSHAVAVSVEVHF
jgi:long-chain fatty acid transport protein